tara:strand:+ start:185 stop:793 length:609 start_codon:yes stop_codon:yes gene_type:complete
MLSVNRSAFHDDELIERTCKKTHVFYQQIIKRDRYTCQQCDFKALKYMRVIAKDSCYHDLKPDNYETVCPFCFYSNRLGLAGMHKSGNIVYLPEISQKKLNNLIHTSWAWQETKGDIEEAAYADSLLKQIYERKSDVHNYLGRYAYKPEVLGGVLKDMSDEYYHKRAIALDPFRFFPDREEFSALVEYWNREVYPDWEKGSV